MVRSDFEVSSSARVFAVRVLRVSALMILAACGGGGEAPPPPPVLSVTPSEAGEFEAGAPVSTAIVVVVSNPKGVGLAGRTVLANASNGGLTNPATSAITGSDGRAQFS